MRLGKKQHEFAFCVAKLILWCDEQGYEVSFGDAYRDPRVFGEIGQRKGYGSANSNHKRSLAVDLRLKINGRYMRSTEAYRPMGEYWESLNELATWGGRDGRNDGNHFSFYHGRQW